jgi:hypothetical protein
VLCRPASEGLQWRETCSLFQKYFGWLYIAKKLNWKD